MSEDLQSLLEKINRDGVQKAQAQADKIVADAKAKADAIVKAAESSAAAAKADADKAAAAYAERAKETIRQAARDIVLDAKNSVDALLDKLLAENVGKALSDPATVQKLVGDAVVEFASKGDVDVALAPKVAATLAASLAAKGNFKVVTDETLDTGFTVKLDGGRVEHSYTKEVIAEELAKRLRPDLAELVK